MRDTDPEDPSLALCQICERAYISKMHVPDKGNDGQIREYRTCALFVTGDCNDFVPLNPNDLNKVKYQLMSRASYGRFD